MWLSDTQLDELCEGISREQKARRCKFLRGLGLRVVETPSGAPRVLCSNVEAVLGGLPPADPKRPYPHLLDGRLNFPMYEKERP